MGESQNLPRNSLKESLEAEGERGAGCSVEVGLGGKSVIKLRAGSYEYSRVQ